MDFELMNLKTGEVFHKTITPISKAISFLHKVQYSKKIMVLSYCYHCSFEEVAAQ